jgi:hypothetical protein
MIAGGQVRHQWLLYVQPGWQQVGHMELKAPTPRLHACTHALHACMWAATGTRCVQVTTVAGTGAAANVDGPALSASFLNPRCTTLDRTGTRLFIQSGGPPPCHAPYFVAMP